MQSEQMAIQAKKSQIRGESLISAKLPAGDPGKLSMIRAEAVQAETAATNAARRTYFI